MLAAAATTIASMIALPDVGASAAAASVSGELYPVTATRIVDTRTGLGAPKAALASGHTLTVLVAGRGGVPSTGAAAAVLTVTALSATRTTALTVYPYGAVRPATPNLVVPVGRFVATEVMVRLGTGRVVVYGAGGSVHVLVHTQAWTTTGATAAAGTRLAPLTPARILDTRVGLGAPRTAVGAGRAVVFAVGGKGGVPATGVGSVALNVTGYAPTATTSLTVYPYGAARPATPNVYLTKGRTVSSAVTARLGSAGKLVVFNAAGTVHVSADVQGAFRAGYAAGGRFRAVQPARLARAGLIGGHTLTVAVAGRAGVPGTTVVAATLALTGSSATTTTALTVYPYGAARPAAPNVYLVKGDVVTDDAVVRLGTGGKVLVYSSAGSATVAVDVQGYYAVPSVPVPPQGPDAITTSGAHSLYDDAKFLFTGNNPAQTGVPAGTIKVDRVGVVRGTVRNGSGALADVAITILKHPEYGTARSAADGSFSLAVNAGGPLVVNYSAAGYSSSQRQPVTHVGKYVRADDVVLVPLDTKVTTVSPKTATTTTAAVSSTVTDADGTRTNAVLFPAGTTATATKPDGTTVALPSTLHVRATEYTVGTTGPERMPGNLPTSSAYTYATELSVDEASSMGATNVDFTKPLANYVDNFLNFPVGTPVPAGFYDRTKGQWVASKNGVVLKILSVAGGQAVLDTDGDNIADGAAQYTALGITAAERARLATTYAAGKTLWRVPITHFTPWDYNWPYGLPDDADNWSDECALSSGSFDLAACNAQAEEEKRRECEARGSIIGCQSQTAGERVAVAGTPLHLVYNSGAAPGRTTDRTIRIPLTFGAPRTSLIGVQLEVDVAGQHFERSFGRSANQSYTYVWNGLDGFGRPVNGAQQADIRIGYVYPAVYKSSSEALAASFALAGTADIRGSEARDRITVWTTLTAHVGRLRPDSDALGGWTLDAHNAYDPSTHTLYLGSGRRQSDSALSLGVIDTQATSATFQNPQDIVAAPDGSLFVADQAASKIYKVSPVGTVTVYAGTGATGYTGDDGPAVAAKLFHPTYLALGPDGSLYVTDGFDAQISRVRRISPNGIITTVAGTFNDAYNGDGIKAVDANLNHPTGIAVGLDGSLYIADRGNARIRRVNPDGIISTVAGDGTFGVDGDGGPAAAAHVDPIDLAVGPDGTVFASTGSGTIRAVSPDGVITRLAGDPSADPTFDDGNALHVLIDPAFLDVDPAGNLRFTETARNRVRQVTPDGGITTIAGTGACATETGDGGSATAAAVCSPVGISVSGSSTFLLQNTGFDVTLRRIGSLWPGFQLGDTTLASPAGDQVFVFDANGRHKRTLDALTGAVQLTFGYDTSGRLVTVTDAYNSVTTIQRSAAGVATSITAPGGQVTALTVTAEGDLASIKDPLGHGVTMTYLSGSLLATYKDALGRQNDFTYDAEGRLTKDTEPDGTFTSLALSETPTKHTVVRTSPGGAVTTFVDEVLSDGTQRSQQIVPNGTTTLVIPKSGLSSTVTRPDGTVVTTNQVPDKRWGMQAPFTSSIAVRLPSHRTYTWTCDQTVTLTDAANPFAIDAVTTTSTADGKTTTTVYTGANRTQTDTSPAGRVSSTVYDPRGRIARRTTATGQDPLVWAYDAKGRVTAEGTAAHPTTLGYDAANRLVSRTTAAGTEHFGYDAAGRVTDRTTGSGLHYQYTYDADDHRTAVIMPGGATHLLGYDVLGTQVSYTPPDNAAYTSTTTSAHATDTTTLPTGATEVYGYDATDRLTSIVYPGASTATTYASNGRPDGQSRTPTGGAQQKTQQAYDGPFITTRTITGPAAGTYAYGYDAVQQIDSIALDGGQATALTYDNDGRLTGDGPFTLDRSGPGGLTSSITDSTMTQTLDYDTENHPTGRTMSVNGTAVFGTTQTYDNAGRVATRTETSAGGTTTFTYSYDADGRLTGVDQDGATIAAYSYDNHGNRVTSGDPAAPASTSYDSQDRIVASAGVAHSYDADGYLTGRGSDTFAYTRRGELTSATVGASTVTYTYDAQRRRVTRTAGGVTTQYLYGSPDDDTLVTATRTAGVTTELFYDGARHLYAMQRGAARFYVATDQVGSPRVVTDSTGTVVDTIDYDAWGAVTAESDLTAAPVIGFAGGLRDPVTGLVRFGIRDYDPGTGRWTARDAAVFDSQQSNLYAYVANSPTNGIDPTGFFGINLGGSICIGFCLEVKLSIGTEGIQACGGTGLGLGAGVDVGVDPETPTDSNIYAGAHAGLGPASLDAVETQGLCGSKGSVTGCITPVCVSNDGPSLSADPSDLGKDVAELFKKPKLSESAEVKATVGGCAGTKW